MADMIKLRLAVIIGGAVIVRLMSWFGSLMDFGLFQFIQDGLDNLGILIGSRAMNIFVALFGLAGFVLIVRFVMSWWGNDPGRVANK